jgi:hypothetical protein
MKLNRHRLKEIIKEEIYNILKEEKSYTVEYWYRFRDEKEWDEIIVKASSEEEAIEKAKNKVKTDVRRGAIQSSFKITSITDLKKTLDENNSNPYDLSNLSVKEEFFNDLISVWTKYCGQNPNSSAIANDNRVILYNMLNDGTIQSKINQIWSPSNLNLGSHGREYPTANPDMMDSHLKNVGITNFELKELK